MDEPTVALRPAADSLDAVERLLAAHDLPTADVRSNPGAFYLAHDGDELVGIGGLEVHGTDGLLRSVVVRESAQGEGIGTAICERLETAALAEGVETLYLLTTTAAGFFADREFATIDRGTVPASIQDTAEFSDLCPDSAAVMRKPL